MFKLKTNKEYIVFLSLLASVSPLATDMYLPAVPQIAKEWQIGTDTASLSLVLYFIFFAAFMLVFGTLSDKFGRKPMLLSGLAIFVIGSFLCAASLNIRQLITWRILQGIGASAPAAISLAICRDIYEGEQRKRALAYIGIILSVVPLTAPTIGSLFLKFADWHFIFISQALLTLLTTLLSFGYTETLKEKLSDNLFHIFSRYKVLFRNKGYILANTVMGLISGPFFGFIAFSPIVYIKIFHLSPSEFGLLFALNAAMSMFGAFVCTRLIKILSDNKIITFGITGCVVSAIALILLGQQNCYIFAAFMSMFTFCCGMTRPLSMNLILSQVRTDIGSASGFIVFYTFVVGSACMAMTTGRWQNPVSAFGIMALSLSAFVLIMWPILLKITHRQNV